MKIVLLGYMGCGKSTIGKALSEAITYDFVDLDDYIALREGMSISHIFDTQGETHFRTVESHYLEFLLENTPRLVLSLGGGTPCYKNNMDTIHQHTEKSVYLEASTETLFSRLLPEKSKRPLISHLSDDKLKSFIQTHLQERSHYYQKAKHTVSLEGLDSKTIVNKILRLTSS